MGLTVKHIYDSTVFYLQAGIASPPILRIQYKPYAGARVLEVPNYVYTRLSIPVKIDEVLKKAPSNRVNIFDNVEEVDMFDRDLDILKLGSLFVNNDVITA